MLSSLLLLFSQAAISFPGAENIPPQLLNRQRPPLIGTGNPKVTKHPMSREACQKKLKQSQIDYNNPQHEKICKAPYMAPLYDPKTQKPEQAKACIDKFEYPSRPCEYPVVWVKASEAAAICSSQGKRLCDAHEWEGACAGRLLPPDYAFNSFLNLPETQRLKARRQQKNAQENRNPTWSYGPVRKTGICGTNSTKTAGCQGGEWQNCGSNTYPVGAFPQCKSALDVYDLHGNAAEHMNLPVTPDQMSSAGSKSLGYTEMKGSWFIFGKLKAHKDHCRWRAPFWHGTKVMSAKSHRNYHLGFRCCKSL